jgi:hypothetical protein
VTEPGYARGTTKQYVISTASPTWKSCFIDVIEILVRSVMSNSAAAAIESCILRMLIPSLRKVHGLGLAITSGDRSKMR